MTQPQRDKLDWIVIGACLLFVLLLPSCAGRERPEPVMIPVQTPCVTGELPAEPPLVTPQLTGNSGRDIGIIAGSAIELRVWGRVLYTLLSTCRGQGLQPIAEPPR